MKTYLFLLALLCLQYTSAQVGIGTTSPDPSSLLDMTSDEKGFLAPRMETSDRLAIVSPAEGLMVYDTDLKAFYIFNGTVWSELGAGVSDGRNNYKLIQSAADLADELTAGGGTTYLLDTDTYYEINGLIVLLAPIDLNEAYISGLDANEDVLALGVAGAIFSGTAGGSIRNLTLTASGGSIFSLTGSGTETLVFQNCIVFGSNSVGAISDFGVVFMNIIQLVSNTTGIIYTDINSLLLSNVAWFSSNGGTYETYVGTFSLIEKISGLCEVSTGVTGIDVSTNPTVSSGNILSTTFSGAGTYVNGYTTGSYAGFNFSNVWNVDCPGLKVEDDNSASANFYYTGSLTTGFGQNITNGTAVEIQGGGTFAATNLFRFTDVGGNRLVYDGIEDRNFQVNASLSVRVTGAVGNFYGILIAKNGAVITESNSIVYIDNDSQIQNIAINTNVDMSNGDYIEVFVDRITGTGTDTLAVFSENLTIR